MNKLIPYDDLLREFFAESPKDVDGVLNSSSMYYREYLLRLIFGKFSFTGIMDNWDVNYMLEKLFIDGGFVITDTAAGVLPLQCGLTGHNVFNKPTMCVVANAILGNFDRVIGETCVYIPLQYTYMGINRLLDRYSYLLAACDSSISVNLMNSKVAFIGEVSNKAQAETMKHMYDKISAGEPAVFRKNVGDDNKFYLLNVKQNFIADSVQNLKRTIINEFLTEIGINNYNIDKRERLNTEEVHGNDDEVKCAIYHWLECVNAHLEKANAMFGLNLKFVIKNGGDKSDESE